MVLEGPNLEPEGQAQPQQPEATHEDTSLENYFNSALFHNYIPKNQFAHAAYMIAPEFKEVTTFSELLHKNLYLGNIESNQYLQLAQRDIFFLTNFNEYFSRSIVP